MEARRDGQRQAGVIYRYPAEEADIPPENDSLPASPSLAAGLPSTYSMMEDPQPYVYERAAEEVREVDDQPISTHAAPPRQAKFQEMFQRSVSSAWGRTKLTGGYEPPSRDESIPMEEQDSIYRGSSLGLSRQDTDGMSELSRKYTQPPLHCHSRRDFYVKAWSWLYATIVFLSVLSTILSGVWLFASIYQPRYGKKISSSTAEGTIAPATASTVTALLAKTTELSFVPVIVTVLGQIITRRAISGDSKGVTLSELTMRNWVFQPGSLITHWETTPHAALTITGLLTLLATFSAMLYTTASDAMVSPKLAFGKWEPMDIKGNVKTYYANAQFVEKSCTTPIPVELDIHSLESCLAVEYSGQSCRNLLGFMDTWQKTKDNGSTALHDLSKRPGGTAIIYDNTTLYTSWIDLENSKIEETSARFKRIVNNVTMAIGHPGVYAAATDPINGILQPSDLSGVGEYRVRASVVSPVLNVMCVNMDEIELSPLVYTTWPHNNSTQTGVGHQTKGFDGWDGQVPPPVEGEWLNKTVMDDVFRWGEKYGRRPPVWQLYPLDSNLIFNTSVASNDSVYILGKSPHLSDYTMCELRSWMSPHCSTHFNISGTNGASIEAHCNEPLDTDAYIRNYPEATAVVSKQWPVLAPEWYLSMDLGGGVTNNNGSVARILAGLALNKAELPNYSPSMAEALAMITSSTLVTGSMESTYRTYWDASYPEADVKSTKADSGVYETFRATIMQQQYTSTHPNAWQGVFYPVLAIVFILNAACLVYLILRRGMVTDYSEPMNLFALAINSPPSSQLYGSCGHGPEGRDLRVPYRVGYADDENHYFMEEANNSTGSGETVLVGGKYNEQNPSSNIALLDRGSYSKSYTRLRAQKTLL